MKNYNFLYDIYLMVICLMLPLLCFAHDVSNIIAFQEGKNIVIEYDLAKQNNVTAYVNIDGSYIELNNVTGDVGNRITAGHKRIVWNVLSQYEKFEYSNVLFKIDIGITSVTDICSNTYPVVKIGEQYWMAENMRCNRYDTKSEAYKTGMNHLSISRSAVYTPYLTDASNKNKWDAESKTKWSKNLSNLQINTFGYLYNWAAAVGVADGSKRRTAFSGNRQGICPNGWHLPTKAEFDAVKIYIETKLNNGSDAAGKCLKTTSGWYSNGNGIDLYGFSAEPSGYSYGGLVKFVGVCSYFWTATIAYGEANAYNISLLFTKNYITCDSVEKYYGRSVRCIKD